MLLKSFITLIILPYFLVSIAFENLDRPYELVIYDTELPYSGAYISDPDAPLTYIHYINHGTSSSWRYNELETLEFPMDRYDEEFQSLLKREEINAIYYYNHKNPLVYHKDVPYIILEKRRENVVITNHYQEIFDYFSINYLLVGATIGILAVPIGIGIFFYIRRKRNEKLINIVP
ncbi:hypothetical protein [Evansella tamaricis]|uniref:Uncharacterized protein n=1 Tax=Evansella tamaricis TaxID=2069301 RepID=A0ABS6JIG7_9BACI|nr:hypothetical protein [Evansella tamaricis]MBU9712133.1 hypothetical protein [Evansella tamaricis]